MPAVAYVRNDKDQLVRVSSLPKNVRDSLEALSIMKDIHRAFSAQLGKSLLFAQVEKTCKEEVLRLKALLIPEHEKQWNHWISH